MPIRFQCDQCGQRLSIARRKSGLAIACPVCGRMQQVPGDPSGEASSETIEVGAIDAESRQPEWELEEVRDVFERGRSGAEPRPIPPAFDRDATIDLNGAPEIPPVAGSPGPPPPPALPRDVAKPAAGKRPLPIPWAVYAQAFLLLSVALGAFSAGYYLGHQDGAARETTPATHDAAVAAEANDGFAEEKVLLEARLRWMPNIGQSAGDQAAVFLALPQDRIPRSSLPIAGLQPGGEDDPEAEASMARIRSAGGEFCRADVDGTVAAVLPREGRYHLLLVSRHVSRPPNQPIRARDLAEMKQYFEEPERLIGASKYAWQSTEIRIGAPAVEHDFGLGGL